MRIVGKSPTVSQLRRDLALPKQAKFLGWSVHIPKRDEFVYAQAGDDLACVRTFGRDPARALRFHKVAEAGTVVGRLNYPAAIVAVFDIGSRLAVITVGCNERSNSDS